MTTRPAHAELSNTQRQPPPTLFQGPTPATQPPAPPLPQDLASSSARPPLPLRSSFLDPKSPPGTVPVPVNPAANDGDSSLRIDALWARMQDTLNDVESSAAAVAATETTTSHGVSKSSTHVFNKSHSDALEDLRTAQIELARAWGRGEYDEDEQEQTEAEIEAEAKTTTSTATKSAPIPTSPSVSASATATSSSKPGTDSGSARKPPGKPASTNSTEPDADADADILEARRRREANERFFQRVNAGVVDVVERLDSVAAAMARVEAQSRRVWNNDDDDDDDDNEEDDLRRMSSKISASSTSLGSGLTSSDQSVKKHG